MEHLQSFFKLSINSYSKMKVSFPQTVLKIFLGFTHRRDSHLLFQSCTSSKHKAFLKHRLHSSRMKTVFFPSELLCIYIFFFPDLHPFIFQINLKWAIFCLNCSFSRKKMHFFFAFKYRGWKIGNKCPCTYLRSSLNIYSLLTDNENS